MEVRGEGRVLRELELEARESGRINRKDQRRFSFRKSLIYLMATSPVVLVTGASRGVCSRSFITLMTSLVWAL